MVARVVVVMFRVISTSPEDARNGGRREVTYLVQVNAA